MARYFNETANTALSRLRRKLVRELEITNLIDPDQSPAFAALHLTALEDEFEEALDRLLPLDTRDNQKGK